MANDIKNDLQGGMDYKRRFVPSLQIIRLCLQNRFLPALICFALAIPATSKATTIGIGSISASPPNVLVVPITISGASDLYAFQFDITFNPSILQLDLISEGPFLQSGGATFFIPGAIDNLLGSATFTADTLVGATTGVSGNGTLATLNFETIAPGSSSFTLSNVILLDSDLNDVPFSVQSSGVSSVPEATSTARLLLAGLAFCGVLRAKGLFRSVRSTL
jgi:hypothetical protein